MNLRPKCKTEYYKNTWRKTQVEHFSDINSRNIFFDPSHRIMEIKTKINKWDLTKFKNFCTAKETINEMKRQPTE